MLRRALLAAFLAVLATGTKADCGFDYEYYRLSNPDVVAYGIDLYQHYRLYGWREGRDPSPKFSTSGYLAANPDVAAAGMDPLDHFVRFGVYEGRRPVPVIDLQSFLAQSRNCDGNPATPLRAADPIVCRLFDAAHEQIVDSFATADGRGTISAMSFTPWGHWIEPATDVMCQDTIRPSRCSDGGDRYLIEGDTVSAPVTRDGGTPYDKWLVGQKCGAGRDGGWLLFRTDAVWEWREVVARLGLAYQPDACPPLGESYTRYARRTVTAPGLGPIDTIVTEHYSHSTEAASQNMERMMFGRGWGRWAWMAFSRQPSSFDVARHCPDFGWNELPGWYLTVCRVSTNVELAGGTLTGAQLWSPK